MHRGDAPPVLPPAPRAGRTPLANFGAAVVAARIRVASAPSAEPPLANFVAAVVAARICVASAPSAQPPPANFGTAAVAGTLITTELIPRITEVSFAPAFILGAALVPLAVVSVWVFGGRIRPLAAEN